MKKIEKNVGFRMLAVWMCPWLVPERLDDLYSYSVFKNLFIIGHSQANVISLASKKG
jgi:hypothetical protein